MGTLGDAGVNGDLIPNDNTFTLESSFAAFLPGVLGFRVSAAFGDTSMQIQTNDLLFTVKEPLSTASWLTLTDTQGLFSIQVPPEWNLKFTEKYNPDEVTLKDVEFLFPDNTNVFIISVYSKAGWVELQKSGLTASVKLGENNNNVFGYSLSEDNDELTRTQLRQVFATFEVK